MTLNYSSIFPRHVDNVQDALPNADLFQCYFGRVVFILDSSKITFMTPSLRIIENPLNSTIFWKRHLNLATRRLNSVTRQLNSAMRQILLEV